MTDRNLICFFSWGRRELVEKSFTNLLESIRPQDKLLVVDQGAYNLDFYMRHLGKIDFLTFFKENYEIGPVWDYVKSLVIWKKTISEKTFGGSRPSDKARAWVPDFVNIVQSDTIGKKGWISRLVKVFDSKENIGIVTGYNNLVEGEVLRKDGDILIKTLTAGVQMMMRTELFLELVDGMPCKSEDRKICLMNDKVGKVIGVLPDEIVHIGFGKGKERGLFL
ncbi:MAG: hypothetical protein U1E54_03840 [Candidatus Levybacteria bacterium]|nr:hypothetical protein [Candidatus Levybacteria bacterium]